MGNSFPYIGRHLQGSGHPKGARFLNGGKKNRDGARRLMLALGYLVINIQWCSIHIAANVRTPRFLSSHQGFESPCLHTSPNIDIGT